MTQGAVSRQSTSLKKFAGLTLSRRTCRGVALAERGADYALTLAHRLQGLEQDSLDLISTLGRASTIHLVGCALTHLRISVLPQRWPAYRGYVRGLRVGPDVLQYLPDTGALRDERDQPHLPTAHRTQQREHLVNAGDLHYLHLVHWAFGLMGAVTRMPALYREN